MRYSMIPITYKFKPSKSGTTVIYEGIRQILCQDKRQKPISKQDVSS